MILIEYLIAILFKYALIILKNLKLRKGEIFGFINVVLNFQKRKIFQRV